jgi:DNA (cytosine-5)-methyltransferase 1
VKPRLLDLFCNAGGAAKGYADAGFEVVGVDIVPQKNYPFEFRQFDAIDFLTNTGAWIEFDVIHASPPCQAYSITKHSHAKPHPKLIEPTRRALRSTGKPYVIENVVGAPLIDPIVLCGAFHCSTTYDDADGRPLVLKRHRLFESNMKLVGGRCACKDAKEMGFKVAGVYGGGSSDRNHAEQVRRGGYTPSGATRRRLMGMDWTTINELSQAIPPAYTEFIGRQLLEFLTQSSSAPTPETEN